MSSLVGIVIDPAAIRWLLPGYALAVVLEHSHTLFELDNTGSLMIVTQIRYFTPIYMWS